MRLVPRRPDAWSRRLSEQVAPGDAAPVCGIEHEFEVRDELGARVDARTLMPDLEAGRRRQDPIDPYARSLADGAVVTADGREAEIAIAPVTMVPGFSLQAVRAAQDAGTTLRAALPAGSQLTGYSTHLSVQAPDRRAPAAARFVAERFAPLLMLGLDRPTSPGLLIRARWNRVEVGGDFVDGDLLQAALVITVACVERATRRGARKGLPPRPTMSIEKAIERYGWYVDRSASGSDLYAAGREGLLRCGRRELTVQEYVSQCWTALEPDVAGLTDAEELLLARDLVSGRLRSALDQ